MSSPLSGLLLLLLGLFLGAALVYALSRRTAAAQRELGRLEAGTALREQNSALGAELESRTRELATLTTEISRWRSEAPQKEAHIASLQVELRTEREAAARRKDDEVSLANHFSALARRALAENSNQFVELARTSFQKEQAEASGHLKVTHASFLQAIAPVGEKLEELNTRVGRLSEDKDRLAHETRTLSQSLRKAEVRGRWGEIQLQRVAELAGMHHRCDFHLQTTIVTADHERKRPDMVVRLPGDRYVVVDAKAVMEAYLSACETEDPAEHLVCMKRHARLVRDKIDELAKIDYARVLERDGKSVADMVVCFLPGEAFFSAAVAHDPGLLDYAAEKRVFLASPTILITLLRAIALGWRDHQLSANAEEVSRLGKELYARLSGMKTHFDRLGSSLGKTVDHYNGMVSTLNKRVFPQARRFRSLGAVGESEKDMGESDHLDGQVRPHDSADWDLPLQLAASQADAAD